MSPDLRVRFIQPPAAIRLPANPMLVRRRNHAGAEQQPEEQGAAPLQESGQAGEETAVGVPSDSSGIPEAAAIPETPRSAAPTPDWAVAQGRFEELLKRIEREATNLERRFAEEIRGLEPQLVRLALGATRKVVGKATAQNEIDIASLIRDGLGKVSVGLQDPKGMVIRIGSDHEAVVKEVLKERGNEGGRIRIEVDRTLKPFACQIRCDMRQVNIDLERELQRLTNALLGGDRNDG